MKIIVMSDSHGSIFNMKALFKIHPDADLYVHTGDGAEDFVRICAEMGKPYLAVRGNCDLYSKLPQLETYIAEDKTLFVTHGHNHGVKYSTERLMYSAAEQEADIILFGHTHEPLCEYVDEECFGRPMYLVNPGSIALPSEGNPTYALIEIRRGQILANVATLY